MGELRIIIESFILTMRNVNKIIQVNVQAGSKSFILTMRNVNPSESILYFF